MARSSRLPDYQHRLAAVGSIRLHYAETPGDGPLLLLVHGIGMDWRVWQAMSRRLAPEFNLVMIDLRGHGRSEKPRHGYTLAHYAADMEDLLDGLDWRRVILIGSSLGGMVAATVEAPEDVVAGRILVDPPITGGPVRDPAMFREILRLKHEPIPVLADFLQRYNPRSGRLYLKVMSEMWHETADGVIEDMLAEEQTYFDIDAALRWHTSPTLLLQAERERGGALSDAGVQRALNLLPEGRVIHVEGAGHAIHADQPARFAEIVRTFADAVVGDIAGAR